LGLKVDYLKLKNFNAIFSTLNLKKIEIDFTKMQNSILLFIGTNGSCKTYILSHIHPFAYVGNVDVRSGQDMIIDGKDGEKEIRFTKDNGDKYIIRHYYEYQKRGRKIHSYIEKNGVEMNTTGLVGSFNEIVEIEFGIDIGFLRVIRLGSNVNNLVSLKSTDRKDFAVKLLNEVDEYIRDYKVALDNSRTGKSQLKSVVDKIKKLNIEDEVIYRNDLDRLETRLSDMTKNKEDMLKSFYKFKGEVESSISTSVDELSVEINKLHETIEKSTGELGTLTAKMGSLGSFIGISNSLDELIDGFKENLLSNSTELSDTNARIELVSKTLMDLKNESMDLDTKIKAFQDLSDIDNIEKDLEFAYKFDKKYEKYYKDFKPKCTRDDLLADIAVMQQLQDMILSTREFSNNARKLYYKFYDEKKNPRNACVNKLVSLSAELSLCSIDNDSSGSSVPDNCNLKEECPFYRSFSKKGNRTVRDIEDDIDDVKQCLKVIDCVANIKVVLESRMKKLPYTVKLNDIILDIMNGTMGFFDFQDADKMVAYLEKYEEYVRNLESIAKYEKDLAYQKEQQKNLDGSIVDRRKKVFIQISDNEKTLSKLKKRSKKLMSEVDDLNHCIEELKEYKDLDEKRKVVVKTLEDAKREYDSMKANRELVNRYDKERKLFDDNISNIEDSMKVLSHTIYNTKVVLTEYEKLKEEKKRLEEDFEIDELIKDSVSSTKGIPLLYLNVHFGNARNIANNIISSVYGDTIKLGRFVIDEKEFRIPYTKNGMDIEDVVYASQGELSVISLAISFALIEEFSGAHGYNVMLLDEVDGPLDKGNKEKFLRVLERQMERIGCQQVCMITHSPLFENYPVDVFVTIDKDNNLDSYKNINVIN
jgi:DNA repair exonuclease SbcCD ATPase subunit